jgi:hypothetical protein
MGHEGVNGKSPDKQQTENQQCDRHTLSRPGTSGGSLEWKPSDRAVKEIKLPSVKKYHQQIYVDNAD